MRLPALKRVSSRAATYSKWPTRLFIAPTKLSIACSYHTASYRKLDGGVGNEARLSVDCSCH